MDTTEMQTVPPANGVRQKIAPAPTLSTRGLFTALALTCILPLIALSVYAAIAGRAKQKDLEVDVAIERRMVATSSGIGAIPTDVVVVKNRSGVEIPKLTIDINGQYFLYQDAPLSTDDPLIVPQTIFATKSNQRFVPGNYPITDITVTGQLPGGARGVREVEFEVQTP